MAITDRKGNILVTFMLLVGITSILLSFIYLVTARLSSATFYQDRAKSFYITEAGLTKAVWGLMTPVSQGGYGSTWRVSNFTESFGGGQYKFTISDYGISTVSIICTGEMNGITNTLQQNLAKGYTPSIFSHAVYSKGDLFLSGGADVTGPVFADGNIVVFAGSSITGDVTKTSGHFVWGAPSTTVSTSPPSPTLDTSYYDNEITKALAVAPGNLTLNGSGDYNLAGGTLYVNGNLYVTDSRKIKGGGKIVVAGTYTNSSSGDIDPNTAIINKNGINISGSGNMKSGAVVFSNENIVLSGSGDITGSVLTSKTVYSSGTGKTLGIVYAKSSVIGQGEVRGSMVTFGGASYLQNDTNIVYDSTKIPSSIPGMVSPTAPMTAIKGSWSGN